MAVRLCSKSCGNHWLASLPAPQCSLACSWILKHRCKSLLGSSPSPPKSTHQTHCSAPDFITGLQWPRAQSMFFMVGEVGGADRELSFWGSRRGARVAGGSATCRQAAVQYVAAYTLHRHACC